MRILGIDPGTVTVGYGCLQVAEVAPARPAGERPIAQRAGNVVSAVAGRSDARVVEAGALRLGRSGVAIEARLGRLAVELAALIERLGPDQMALEGAFAGKSVQAALRIGEARGVVLAAAHRAGVSVVQLAPARVKRCLTGHGAAGKPQVANMTCQLLGLAHPPQPHDVADALAVAYACAEQRFSLRHASSSRTPR
ncbi:MAG: crossover junction endodeoxyribonuclease RuvC [Planctomycetota bacterium]